MSRLNDVRYLRGASRSLDSVRTAPKSKKKPPTASSPRDDARRWREGAAAPRDAEIILPLRFVVHHVGDVFLLHFFSGRARVDTYRRDTDGPGRVADRDENISVVRSHELSVVAVLDHLEQRRFDRRLEALALAEPREGSYVFFRLFIGLRFEAALGTPFVRI